jgi:phospholipid transport system substrate-binding protein
MFKRQSDGYQGKGFDIVDIRPADRGRGLVFVRTLATREARAPARLTWRIREQDGQFKILDLSVAGVSMVLTLRQEYNSVIRQAGGVGGLVDLMREKLLSGAYSPKEKDDQ